MDNFFKFLEKFINFLNYLKIAAAPSILGVFIGIVIYANKTDELGLALACGIGFVGILSGIILANTANRKVGTSEFVARASASPDIDEAVKKQSN